MSEIRFGVIGVGNMGAGHSSYLVKGFEGGRLTAFADVDPKKRETFAAKLGVPAFATHTELLASNLVDAIIIAVPHYDHVPVALDAFAAGVHVMCEKPIAVSVKAARHINAEYEAKYKHLKFGIMFQQRTTPVYRKLRELIQSGELGEIKRITWIATDWFRTWSYYASGGWRATWAGEGGGVLINQCPHNLDLIQWITGMMPKRVIGHASIGRYHPIEVEDDVHATMLYENGAVGHFITTTGEAPGSNRLEISCDRGRLVIEHGKLSWTRARVEVQEFNRTTPESFAQPEFWNVDVPIGRGSGLGQHEEVTRAFIRAIRDGSPMIADGVEGVRGLELGNAMLLAGLSGKPVDLPVDGDAYDAFILELDKKYGGRKTLEVKGSAVAADFASSFR